MRWSTALCLGAAAGAAAQTDLSGVPSDVFPQLANKLDEGYDLGESTIDPGGKSGRIELKSNAPPTQWTPKYAFTGRELQDSVNSESLVLVLWFSSAEHELSESQQLGLEFEKAAAALLENEHQIPCMMIDIQKYAQLAKEEYGVTKGPAWKLVKDGRPRQYNGPRDAEGIVEWMLARAGSPVTKLETARELDIYIAEALTAVVVGVFGGSSGRLAREGFVQNGEWLRDEISYVEVNREAANGAAVFAGAKPFKAFESSYAVVPAARWLGKAEAPFHHSSDFKTMHRFVPAHMYTLVSPMTDAMRAKATKEAKPLVALLYNDNAARPRFRYVLKKIHKLIESDADFGSTFAFTLSPHAPLPPFLASTFDHSTWDAQTGARPRFISRWDDEAADFQLLVHNGSTNYACNLLANATADAADLQVLAPFLQRIVAGVMKPLIQGDDAPAAAGLKTMSMGFGPDGGGMTEMGGGGKKKKKKGKKGKKALGKPEEKGEL